MEIFKLHKEIEKYFSKIEKLFTKKTLWQFKNTSYDDLCLYHFGLGTWIRNNLLYPENNTLFGVFIEYEFTEPDDMSAVVISEFYDYIQKKR